MKMNKLDIVRVIVVKSSKSDNRSILQENNNVKREHNVKRE